MLIKVVIEAIPSNVISYFLLLISLCKEIESIISIFW